MMLMQTTTPPSNIWLYVVVSLSCLIVTPAFAENETRVSEAREFQFGEAHEGKSADHVLKNTTLTSTTKASPTKKKRMSVNSMVNTDFWIYDAWVERYNDADYDGYATTVSVAFDADTIYAEVPVYAVLYIGDAENFYPVHESSVFYIYGESTSDEFIIETDLISGYRPYDYDIMIELYDAQTDALLAVSDHTSDADLSYVPLESQNYDRVIVEQETVVEVRSHGGAVYWPALGVLLAVGLGRRWVKHRSQR